MLFGEGAFRGRSPALHRILNLIWNALRLIAARRWGRRSIWLRVCPTNAAAIELYRSFGYEEVQLREPPWFKSLRRNDDVLMCKSLPQMPPVSCSQQDSVKRTGTRDKREVPSELRMEPLGESGEKKKVYRWDEEE